MCDPEHDGESAEMLVWLMAGGRCVVDHSEIFDGFSFKNMYKYITSRDWPMGFSHKG